jgi:hypothetical protein
MMIWQVLHQPKEIEVSMAVTLVNCFEVPAGREGEFLALWQQVNEYMRAKKGYLEHELHRSMAPDARFRFVNVANGRRWRTSTPRTTPAFATLSASPPGPPSRHLPRYTRSFTKAKLMKIGVPLAHLQTPDVLRVPSFPWWLGS